MGCGEKQRGGKRYVKYVKKKCGVLSGSTDVGVRRCSGGVPMEGEGPLCVLCAPWNGTRIE